MVVPATGKLLSLSVGWAATVGTAWHEGALLRRGGQLRTAALRLPVLAVRLSRSSPLKLACRTRATHTY